MTLINQAWVLADRPTSTVGDELKLVEMPVDAVGDDQILVRNLYLSLDPTNRLWMSDRDQYMPPVQVGDVMRGTTIGRVEQSRSADFAPGDYVLIVFGGWQLYSIEDSASARRIPGSSGLPLSSFLSILGTTGITAYFGVKDICRPQPDQTIVVSAAAGAVGSIAGQIAKMQGSRVIGIAGGPEKCSWLVDELGFDGAIDYKNEDVGSALDRLCPSGIDMSFENVGGAIMNDVFSRLNTHGRMALCGLISGYNDEGPLAGPTDFGRILMHRLTVRGFLVSDYFSRLDEAVSDLASWIGEGRIVWKDHIVDGLEVAPKALNRLFRGEHNGKLIVRISEES
ncbi:NADP-dependent oxidoreductase [Rhodococcus sp. BE178]|uniref:NADP-dependent oxidoreductase n=1 Tax=Rhodococcus sp. BE178 TaxID=2817737 RepID=UPI003D23035E